MAHDTLIEHGKGGRSHIERRVGPKFVEPATDTAGESNARAVRPAGPPQTVEPAAEGTTTTAPTTTEPLKTPAPRRARMTAPRTSVRPSRSKAKKSKAKKSTRR